MTPQETAAWLERWRALPAEEQHRAERERRWALADWLHWLRPDERSWYWWDAAVNGSHELRVRVEVPGWPAALGALTWLLRAAGADSVSVEEHLQQ